jgi:DNA-binding HxlR family transcriptional regulator
LNHIRFVDLVAQRKDVLNVTHESGMANQNFHPLNRQKKLMALGHDYEMQDCPIARALELVGERWTLLIIRDCFLGVSRFNDFLAHLDVPKAILSARLEKLVASGILRKKRYGPRQYDYLLTERGTALFPILYGFAVWGDTHHAPSKGRRRVFSHVTCGTELDPHGVCPTCKTFAAPDDVEIRNGAGAELDLRDDIVTKVLSSPHRLLSPLMISSDQAEVRASRGHTSRKLRG